MDFDGLPADYFRFFKELSANNNREWFEANKARFKESVQAPLVAFVEAMAPRLKKVSKHFVADPRLNGGSIFRIYKDVRFSKDRTPYKTHGGVQFRHARGKDAHAPGFYVHMGPGEVFFGGGIWMPPSDVLLTIRQAILKTPSKKPHVVAGQIHDARSSPQPAQTLRDEQQLGALVTEGKDTLRRVHPHTIRQEQPWPMEIDAHAKLAPRHQQPRTRQR